MHEKRENVQTEVGVQNKQAIADYMHYLKEQAGFSVSLHFHTAPTFYARSFLDVSDVHDNPYCAYLRLNKAAHWKCLECQRKAAAKCKKTGAYSGVCHAGVFEYVYPILLNGKPEGMLSVSGYAVPDGVGLAESLAVENDLDTHTIHTLYSVLNKNIPTRKEVDTLIYPLLNMIELLSYKEKLTKEPTRKLSDKILEYCRRQHLKKITADDLCKRFFCSRSYIAHLFKKKTGRTLPGYINYCRIQTAMQILKESNTSLEEVASLCGFEDRGHFSKCFKKETGISPREWRKQNME